MTQPPYNPNGDNPFNDSGSTPSGAGGQQPGGVNYPSYGSTGGPRPGQHGQTPYEAAPAANYGGYAGHPGGDPMYGQTEIAAGPWRRLGAYLIDCILLGIVVGLISAPFIMPEYSMDMTQAEMTELTQPFSIIGTVVIYLYFTILHTTSFSTIGKRLLGIRVTNMDLQPISFGTSAIRSLWLLVGLIPFVGTLLSTILSITIFVMLFTGDRTQGLHDKWSKTRGVLRTATNY